jgi:HK97 family phage major capsid protein
MKKNIFRLSGVVMFVVALVCIFVGGAEAAGVLLATGGGLTVDEQVAEKLKTELKNLGDQIDGKVKTMIDTAQEAAIATGNANAAEISKALKEELTGMISKHAELHEKFTERLDLIETKAGKLGAVVARKNMADIFMEKMNEINIAEAFRKSGHVDVVFKDSDFDGINIKQDDMTSSNTFTNNVPGYDHLNEIHFDPERSQRARDTILQGTTNMTAIEYIRESGETDNTGMTAEGAEFNQNDFDLTAYTANVRKITAYIMLSEEMLEDVAGLTSYIMAKLPGKINKVEDEQIIKGAGTGQNLSGLITNATAYSDNLADSNVQRIDVLVDAIRQIADDEYRADFITLHPADFSLLALTKDSNGQYLLPWIMGVPNPNILGVPIVQTTAMTEGDFLLHARNAAQAFFKKELTIEFSNQNEDNFVKGMVTVRAQKRLALPIYKPTAILTGDFTVALAQGTA